MALLLLLTAATSIAQTLKVSGTLEGTVSDTTGGRIPGAEVRLRQIETNRSRTVTTDDQGAFRATDLAVGTYEVRAEHAGFAPYQHTGVRVGVGSTVHLEIVLPAASVTTQVTVSAQPSPIDPTQPSVTSTVEGERIQELPVRSRNALEFVLLAPGVAASPQAGGSSPHQALADSGFTFGGLRPRNNSISIDGLDNNDEYTGSSRTELSPEIVQEYQVVNSGLSAEYGGASGGSINVLTRTGSNVLHGDAFIFIQDGALNARDPFETGPDKPGFRRYRVGAALGGPIVKNRTFFYAAFEQESSRGQVSSDIDPGVASSINDFLASGTFPRLATRQITTGFFPVVRAETEASGKLNHQINAQNLLMLRYAFTNNRESGDSFNTTGLEDASAHGSSFIADHALVGSLVSTFGSNAVGELRFQLATRRAVLHTNDAVGSGIDIIGLVHFGRPYAGNSRRRENHYQTSYTYAQTKGRHLWKIGGTVNRVSLDATAPDGFGSLYLFGSLPDFFAGRPDSFRQAFGDPHTSYAVTSYGAFVQDHWSVFPRVTLDLGLRYDFEHLPGGFNQETNSFSPRVGLAYSPGARWVLRAGYGIFYDRHVLANLNRAIEEDGLGAFEQVANGDQAAVLFQAAGGGPLAAPTAGIRPSAFRPDPGLATPYSQQASFGGEYLLAANLTVSASYLFVRGVKLSRTRNINLLPPVVLTPQNAASLGIPNPTPQQIGREVFGPGRSNPQFNDIYRLEDAAGSTYHGLTISLNRRMAEELQFVASYTVSKTFDDASDFDEQPQNPFSLHAERAVSRQHQQQRLVFSALWELPIGKEEGARSQSGNDPGWISQTFEHIELASIVIVGTGRPVNPLVGLDANRNDAFPLSARPLGFARNSLQTPAVATVDLRVLKYFPVGEHRRLDLAAEFFNLFNRTNVSTISPFFGTDAAALAGFGRPIQHVSPRQIQVSVDFEF